MSFSPKFQIPHNFIKNHTGKLWLVTEDHHFFRYSENDPQTEYVGHFDFIQFYLYPPFEDQEGNIWLPHFYGLTRIQTGRKLFANFLNRPLDELGNAQNAFSTYGLFGLDDTSLLVRIANEREFGIRLNVETGDYEQINLKRNPRIKREEFLTQIDSAILKSLEKRVVELKRAPKVEVDFWLTMGNHPTQFFDFQRRIFWITKGLERGIYALPFDEENYQYYQLFEQPVRFFSIHPLGDSLWLGTERGLFTFHPKTGALKSYTTADGLPHNIVYTILSDGPILWLGTHNGLCRFDSRSGESRSYYVEDGLTHNEFNRASAHRAEDGRMYFGGLNGINAFYPEELEGQQRHHRGRLLLSKFSKIDGRTDSLHQRTGHQLAEQEPIRLHPGDRSLHFEFALTSYSNPAQNKYF